MDVHDALAQIAQIRTTMARAEVFRGYSSAAAAATAVVGVVAAWVQHSVVPDPLRDVDAFLAIWAGAAVLGLCAAAASVVLRCRRTGSDLDRDKAILAAELFAPPLVAGALVTYVIRDFMTELTWMLPGLWAVLFSMGLFASRRVLPRGVTLVGGFYLVAGLVAIRVCHDDRTWSGAAMGVTFGAGQLAAAGMLLLTVERRHGLGFPQQHDRDVADGAAAGDADPRDG